MTQNTKKDRSQILAEKREAALRENLKRRKAQAQTRKDNQTQEETDPK